MPTLPSVPPAPAANPLTLGTFKADLIVEIGRGSSVTARLPGWLRTAVSWLEQNFTFEYMKKEYLLTQLAGQAYIAMPSNLVKGMLLVQPAIENADGSVALTEPLPKVNPNDVLSIDHADLPSGWWLTGANLHFDSISQVDQKFRARYAEYSLWPTADSAQPLLLLRYENLLRAQFMLVAWTALKDFEAAATWKATRDEALRAVLVAEDEAEWNGQDLWMDPQ